MKLTALIIGLLLLMAPQCHAWELRHYDCDSPTQYMESNALTFVKAVKSFFPGIGTQPGYTPEGTGWTGLGYAGFQISIARLYLMLGFSPAAVINTGLHIVCLSLE